MDEIMFDIEREISLIKTDLNSLVRQQRMTNALLRVMLEEKTTKLPQTLWPYVGKSFSIVYRDYSKIVKLVEELAKKDGKQFAEYDGESLLSLSQTICSLKENDYLLIKCDDLIEIPGSIDLIINAYNNGKITIFIGRGEQAKSINIDVPNINYIIYSKIEGLIPIEVKSLFSVVN